MMAMIIISLTATINDLKVLSYIDVLKIFLSYIGEKKEDSNGIREATQEDIEKIVKIL